MLSSSLAPISCTNPRFWAKPNCSLTLHPLVALSGKEETNCLLCRKAGPRPVCLQNSKFSADAFTWGSVCRYYKTQRPNLGEGSHSRAFTFLTISYSLIRSHCSPTSIAALLNYLFKNLILAWGIPLWSQTPLSQIFQIAVTVSLYCSFSPCSLQD